MPTANSTGQIQSPPAAAPNQADGNAVWNMAPLTKAELERRIQELQPWRMSIQVTAEVNTGDFLKLRGSGADCRDNRHKAKTQFLKLIDTLYPSGLLRKRFMDCGCNGGGHCFWARERKAELCYGFDAREHWIKQARFIKNRRTVFPCNRMQFEILNLYDIAQGNLDPFDIVQFKNLFYHLPDPIGGLKLASDLSRDVLIFSSAFVWGIQDGSLKSEICEKELLHGGMGDLRWFPTGPQVCIDIIKSLGFDDVKLTKLKQVKARPDRGRLEIIAARDKNRLKDLKPVATTDVSN